MPHPSPDRSTLTTADPMADLARVQEHEHGQSPAGTVMENTIVLTIDTLTLPLARFAKGGAGREIANEGGVDYTPIGSGISTGARVEKYLWSIDCWLTEEEWQLLQRIYQRAKAKRLARQEHRVFLDDFAELWVDDVARQYALAPTGTVSVQSGLVTYPRRFAARILQPKATWSDNVQTPRRATFTLAELGAIYA
jgi:hypothetical protein